ncbi:MAG: LPS-assembly protein LptD [Pyrinomonadaceae bacterium]|nr:LPS-assembly protein LptD [Pyrinomonadaceae bacterium]
MRFIRTLGPALAILAVCLTAAAQDTNPVERQVSNPITDTPNINPVSAEQSIAAPKPKRPTVEPEGGDGEVVVYSERQTVEGEKGKRIVRHSGNVDLRYGIYRLQADEIAIYEAENRVVARGSVIFDQGDDQRITGATAVWNYKTKLGSFEDSTGFTNQTNDGTVIYFSAARVERVSLNEIVVTKGKFTACEEAVPKWSFTAERARIRTNDKIKLRNVKFRVKDVPILLLPFASIPIKERDRSSGFLTPAGGYSSRKGVRLSGAYYLTLGRSADVTFRADVFSKRGVGYGADFRTRANSRSYLNFGFYAVKDRLFGPNEDAQHPNQGGSLLYAEGVHYFPNGFTASADIRLTSSLAFRQEFAEGIQQIISPIEVSQVFVNKSWNDYTLNFLTRSQVISIPNVREKTRNLPSIHFEKRPTMPSFLKGFYFSYKAALEGVSRREEVSDLALYRSMTGTDPVVSPSLVQRLDIYPQVTLPLQTKYFNFTATGSARVTYYSNSFNDMRQVVGRDVIRKYGEFAFDIRPVALAKNYYGKGNAFKFRHVIEPYATYRLVRGVNNFHRVIRFDYVDTIANTNEVEYGVINRFYTRRYGEAVTATAQQQMLNQPKTAAGRSSEVQPYEVLTVTVRGKYYFDESFGGALIPGRRNQIEPITALSFYTFGGVPRRLSPLAIDVNYRPRRTIFANTRMDVGLNGDGIRAISATIGVERPLFKLFQTFYYTRAVTLMPSLAQYAGPGGKEPGTLRGSQWSPSVFVGNRDRGLFGGTSFFFDFQNRRASRQSPMVSALATVGYAYDCCSIVLQYYTFNIGVRKENRLIFSFRLNGLGSLGTELPGQALR